MKYVNLTPHDICLNNGTVIKASGKVARVSTTYSNFDENKVATVTYGSVENLPLYQEDTIYIVSTIVAQAAPYRDDLVSPATNHPAAVRDEKGQIVSVPGFIRYCC